MRILCCLNADVVSNVALNLLLPALAPHEVHVALSARVGGGADHLEPPPRRELRVAEQGFANDVLFPLVERAGFADVVPPGVTGHESHPVLAVGSVSDQLITLGLR